MNTQLLHEALERAFKTPALPNEQPDSELHIFYCENRLARACPARRSYWQKKLNDAWRRLTRQQKAGNR